jgi:CHAT domain-containing protein
MGFIPCPDGTYLQDRFDIHIVSSTAVVCDDIENFNVVNASLYGGINYSGEDNNETATVIRGLLNKITNSDDRGTFGYLVASNREVDEINNLLTRHRCSTNLLKGTAANEFSFRELDGASPSILHLSTHGFYLVGFDSYSDYFDRLLSYTQSDSDMTKSGILLADANVSLNKNSNPVLTDGVLTAEEISWMDLSNTRLVVLSACETAVGHNVKEGWGGLPRAFKMAGAQHIVASLWRVSDEVTAELMILFYKNMMSGIEPHESLIRSQREIALRYPDPYYWAAFIMID